MQLHPASLPQAELQKTGTGVHRASACFSLSFKRSLGAEQFEQTDEVFNFTCIEIAHLL
jgi:hypothetical protein